MRFCKRCEAEYERIFEIARAEGYKRGFMEGSQVFLKEIALANAMRPKVIYLAKDEQRAKEAQTNGDHKVQTEGDGN